MAVINVTTADTLDSWRIDINTLGTLMGDTTTVLTTVASTIVGAINELEAEIGVDLSGLDTDDKSSLVAAINELHSDFDNIADIGDLNDLYTTDKSNIVASMNETHEFAVAMAMAFS